MDILNFYTDKLEGIVELEVFLEAYRKNNDTLEGLREFGLFKDKFSMLLYLFPLPEKRMKILSKLPANSKYGMIADHLIKCSYQSGIPGTFIEKFKSCRDRYKSYKKYEWEGIEKIKDEMNEMTILLLQSCVNDYSKDKIRQNKLNTLLKE